MYGVGAVLYGATWEFKNWTAAVQSCKDKGMRIAFPQNPAENAKLLQDIQASFSTHPNARKYAHENWVRNTFHVFKLQYSASYPFEAELYDQIFGFIKHTMGENNN